MSIRTERVTDASAEPDLRRRYHDVPRRIDEAAARCGRRGEDIVLVAVTKAASVDQIRQLIELGHQDFGENRVQNLQKRIAVIDEFVERHHELSTSREVHVPDRVRWHMVGHLQRNKVRKIVDIVRLIHSVDSLRIAEEIQHCAARLDEPVEVLVQANVSNEKQKFGVAPAAAPHLVDQIDTMMGIRPRGLMCMAPYTDEPQSVRPVFERCRELFDDICARGLGGDKFDILSMGMSSDFKVAIECGANVVRVGSAIFGDAEEVDVGAESADG